MTSAKLSSDEISQWVGEVCDLFDQRWQKGCYPHIEDVIPPDAEERGVMLAMLRDLLPVDMEYRWRNVFESPTAGIPNATHRPWLEDYVRRFPILAKSSTTVLQLLRCEYRTRQVWGDRPSLATYTQRFPRLENSLASALHTVLNDLVDTEVKVFRGGKHLFTARAARPISIGRQRANEPNPVWMDQDDDIDRLVIAPANDCGTSRDHLFVELVAVNRLVIVNRSETVEVHLGESDENLMPGEICRTCPPVSISIGETVVRATTTSKIPGLEIHSLDPQIHET